jgi:hypothetical protein
MRTSAAVKSIALAAVAVLLMAADGSCGKVVQSVSGTKMATAGKINTDPTTGLTVEQDNVRNKIVQDNKPGAIKHLYVISAYSGQVLIYSTVKGKVTSSGKRLTPADARPDLGYFVINSPAGELRTSELLGEDGTYGSSTEYLYWWDTRGVYHQHYVQGGQIVHISDQPLSVRGVLINMAAQQ